MPNHKAIESIECAFQCALLSPRGSIEGCLLQADDSIVQLIWDDDAEWNELISALKKGSPVAAKAHAKKPSDKGASDHGVFELDAWTSISGKPWRAAEEKAHGKVARLNYARHGEPNGVVLDSGDFVHLKPHGFAHAKLKVGDPVDAKGPRRRLRFGSGSVVEAHEINGHKLDHAPKRKAS